MGSIITAMNIWDYLILFTTIISSLWLYGKWKNKHFSRRGIKHNNQTVPFFGNMWNIFLNKEHFVEAVYKIYNKYIDERYIGFIAFRTPIVIIKDLEIIKQIGVKEFDQFVDHKIFFDGDSDPLFGKNLFFLRGQKWKDMRITMSPAYTSSKMKNMFPMFLESAEQCVEYFKTQSKGVEYLDVEMKDVFTRYTSDVIASTAFGLKVNSFEDKNNQFYLMGKKATNFSGVQFLKFLGYGSFPRIMKFFKVPLFSAPVAAFFRSLVHNTINIRTKQGITRPDMIHLLMLAKKGSLKFDNNDSPQNQMGNTGFASIQETVLDQGIVKQEWGDDDLTAQAMAFLLAGFDTSSSLICFMSFELALNTDIQKKLQNEIDEVITRCEGKLTYNELMNLKYIDMVVSESLRKWPPDSHLDRVCNNNFILPPPNDNSIQSYELTKGAEIWIPTYAIHHDSRYYPDPEKFDPERFSDENKSNLTPYTFIPFGIGPRFCIGARFAVLEAKIIIFYLLAYFDIIKTEKTTVPLKLAKNTFIMHSEGGFHLGLKPRKRD